jgi:hypothetical protein
MEKPTTGNCHCISVLLPTHFWIDVKRDNSASDHTAIVGTTQHTPGLHARDVGREARPTAGRASGYT